MRLGTALSIAAAAGTLFVLLVPRWHHPVDSVELGYRGGAAVQYANAEPEVARINRPPAPPPPGRWGVDAAALADTRPATEAYQNLKVVRDGTAGEFMKLQVALTQWVSPKEGCGFCHQGGDWASDAKPQKQAARVMIDMVRTVNADWKPHVGEAGVTCFICHRGQNIPSRMWFPAPAPPNRPFVARQEAWHELASTVRDFFPNNGFDEYFLQDTRAKGASYTALPTNDVPAQGEVKRLYEMMMQMSDGIGVNCGFCHQSRSFQDWAQSTPHRWTGLSGLHLTRAINNDVLLPLATLIPQTREYTAGPRLPIIPAHEAGPQNGNGLANCATCHYGVPKPLEGQNLLADYPALQGGKR